MTPEEREASIFYVALATFLAIVLLALIYTYAITP
jgi:hypothetical protein